MDKLAVVIIHYHLRPGGVTRVIERAAEALGNQIDLLVLSGEEPSTDALLASITETVPALAYSDQKPDEPERQAEELRAVVRRRMGRDPDIWHIHNHSLGKNGFMPCLVWHLARAGCRLLLQPHDFAEDGRPDNYRLLKHTLGDELDDMLYPMADHIGYAPINCRDKNFLEHIGIPHVHELPNAVTAHPPAGGNAVETGKTVVYPARAIRRKNLGEFLLWSLLAPEGYTFQSTLAPQNPAWRKYYDEWVAFAEELNLPVEFDAGRKHDFAELIRNAEALMSTSIAEGFGLAFMEPWLEGKMLIGRKLPEITADFENAGLDLSTLYSSLPVPLEWVGEGEFLETLECAMQSAYAAYARPWKKDCFEQAKAELIRNGNVDFGILDEVLQRKVIRHLVRHAEDRALLPSCFTSPAPERIEYNRRIIVDHYSLAAYGARLMDIYSALAAVEPGPVSSADAAGLLDSFLQPGRFNLLRT